MDRFQRSWQLLQSSFAVMSRDRKLLLFPLLTTVFTGLLALLFLAPIALEPTGHRLTTAAHWIAVGNSLYSVDTAEDAGAAGVTPGDTHPHRYARANGVRPLAVAYFVVMYFASMYLATFFNVAFYSQILNALRGEPVSIAGGLRFAATKWQAILMWTAFAGLLGYVIKSLEQRFGLIGQIILKLIGTAWSVACVFVIPVIVTDAKAVNPFQVLKQSALTLKRTWGESLIGYAGVSFGTALVLLLSVVWLGGGILLAVSLHFWWLIAVVAAVWLMAIVLWTYLLSVASQIFRCALFLYASQGSLPAPYTDEMMAMAWRMKKR